MLYQQALNKIIDGGYDVNMVHSTGHRMNVFVKEVVILKK